MPLLQLKSLPNIITSVNVRGDHTSQSSLYRVGCGFKEEILVYLHWSTRSSSLEILDSVYSLQKTLNRNVWSAL
jgi:hypothetical protein